MAKEKEMEKMVVEETEETAWETICVLPSVVEFNDEGKYTGLVKMALQQEKNTKEIRTIKID